MGQTIEIQTDVKYLVPGETVRVPIVIDLDKPTKVRNISARFHAAERAKATYTERTRDSKGRTKTQTKTAVATHDIVDEKFLLEGEPPLGCLAGMADGFKSLFGAGRGLTLDTGRHEYSVEFTIPDYAPPSITGKKCKIFYELSVNIDLPMAMDPKETYNFNVAPTVKQLEGQPAVEYFPDENGRGFWDRTFGKDARLTLAVKNDVATAGDKIVALFQAETDSTIKIKSATARLVCQESTRVRSHSDSHSHLTEPVTIASAQEIDGGFSTELILDAEMVGPPTASGNDFKVEWFIEVTLDVPWAKDPTIRLPIRMVGSS